MRGREGIGGERNEGGKEGIGGERSEGGKEGETGKGQVKIMFWDVAGLHDDLERGKHQSIRAENKEANI